MEQEQFLVWSPDAPITTRLCTTESGAIQQCEDAARAQPGIRVYYAQVVDYVVAPRCDVVWNKGGGRSKEDPRACNIVTGAPPILIDEYLPERTARR